MLIVKHSAFHDGKNKTKNSTLDLKAIPKRRKKVSSYIAMPIMSHVFLPYPKFTLIITQLTTLFLANHHYNKIYFY